MWLIEPEFSDGDLHTRFFHAAALARRKVHTIKSLLESNDVIVDKEEDIPKVTLDYSGDLFECQNTVWSLCFIRLA